MIVLRIFGILLLILLVLGIALVAFVLHSAVRIELRRNMPDGPLRIRIGLVQSKGFDIRRKTPEKVQI